MRTFGIEPLNVISAAQGHKAHGQSKKKKGYLFAHILMTFFFCGSSFFSASITKLWIDKKSKITAK